MTVCSHEDVLWFEIPVDEAHVVQVLEGENDLGSVESDCVLFETALRLTLENAEELSSSTIVHDETKTVGGLEGGVHGDDERMICGCENFTFSHDALDLVFLNHFVARQNLHGVELIGALEADEENLADAASAEKLESGEMLGSDLVVVDGEGRGARNGDGVEDGVIAVWGEGGSSGGESVVRRGGATWGVTGKDWRRSCAMRRGGGGGIGLLRLSLVAAGATLIHALTESSV